LNDVYYTPEGGLKADFYNVTGIPWVIFDGYEEVVGGTSGGSMFPTYDPIVVTHLADDSPISLDAFYRWETDTAGTLFVNIDVDDAIVTTDNFVHFVVCEEGLAGYPNMARGMLADEVFGLTLPGEDVSFIKTFTLDPAWNPDDVTFVVFVQSHDTSKEVLQAKQARIGHGILVSPEDDLAAEGDPGGPYTPSSIIYTIENAGPASFDYVVSADEFWVTVIDGEGTLPGYGTAEVTVELNELSESLGDGYYTSVVTFENTTNHIGDDTRVVTVCTADPELIHTENLDADPLWTAEPEWAYGTPTGGGGSEGYPDPTSGHTGDNVYGYNLDGDYDKWLAEIHLTSQPFDCTGVAGTTMRFWRWLGVDESAADHAYVRVSANGSDWTTVWANSDAVTDSAWVQVEYDISSVADDQPTVYLRWTMGRTDPNKHYCGWNVDDVEIWGLVMTQTTGIAEDDLPGRKTLVNYPNPFRPSAKPVTTIAYELASPAHVRLAIYDVSGRLVRVIKDAPAESGKQMATWDGMSEGGMRVASGVYFCRLDAGSQSETRRIVLLK
jgi:hypothetical protein